VTRRPGAAALAALVCAALLAAAGSVQAQRRRLRPPPRPVDPLQAAEEAFTEVDFERTIEQASTALQAGGYTPERLVRIYQLLGVSAAALGDSDGARDFFQRMLAIDAEATLDDSVPPRLRAPFLEARGIVSARRERLGVTVGLARAQASLRVALTDPFEMARSLRVHARVEGTIEYTTVETEASPEVLAPIPGADTADRLEYWIEVLDPYGNQLLVVGTEFEPRVVGRIAVADLGSSSSGMSPPSSPPPGGPSILEEPLFWIVTGGVIALGAGIGIGVAVDSASHVPLRTAATIGLR
jgi:hypothetical protein